MSAPTATAGTTTAYPLAVGEAPLRITDGANNAPAGLALINRGDHGGTITVQAGPTGGGAAVPLGPGGTLQWTDPVTMPYAVLAPGATAPETLVVTSQGSGYSNPTTVAAATALQLAAQGIPTVYTDAAVGSFTVAAGASTGELSVAAYASLVVSVSWPGSTGHNACVLTFHDPAVTALAPASVYLTGAGVSEQAANTWVLPVTAGSLRVTNPATADSSAAASVSIVGTNRPVQTLRMLGDEMGVRDISVQTLSQTGTGATWLGSTRMAGPCILQGAAGVTGVLLAYYTDHTGASKSVSWRVTTANTSFQWTLYHPRVPVYWRYVPDSVGNNACILTVSQS